jgi:hypothetical protein
MGKKRKITMRIDLMIGEIAIIVIAVWLTIKFMLR